MDMLVVVHKDELRPHRSPPNPPRLDVRMPQASRSDADYRWEIERDLRDVVDRWLAAHPDRVFSAEELALCNHIHECLNVAWVETVLDGRVEAGDLVSHDGWYGCPELCE